MFQRALKVVNKIKPGKSSTSRLFSGFSVSNGELPYAKENTNGTVASYGTQQHYTSPDEPFTLTVSNLTKENPESKQKLGEVTKLFMSSEKGLSARMELYSPGFPGEASHVAIKEDGIEKQSYIPDPASREYYISQFFKFIPKNPNDPSLKFFSNACLQAASGLNIENAFENARHKITRRTVG